MLIILGIALLIICFLLFTGTVTCSYHFRDDYQIISISNELQTSSNFEIAIIMINNNNKVNKSLYIS